MKKPAEKGGSTYPHSIRKVYLNLFTAILSVLLALILLLHEPLLLLTYIIFSSSLIAVLLRLKIHHPNLKKKFQAYSSEENEDSHKGKWLILMFALMIIALASPFLLAAVLPPYIWLILIVGVGTGFSVAELLFYIRRRRGAI